MSFITPKTDWIATDAPTEVDFNRIESNTDYLHGLLDIDGNLYKTVRIGNQIWTAENWRSTLFKNGAGVDLVTGDAAWAARVASARCFFGFDGPPPVAFGQTRYGFFYNGFTVTDASGIAPDGWRVPTVADVNALKTYLANNRYTWDGSTDADKDSKAVGIDSDAWALSSTLGHTGYPPVLNNATGLSLRPGGDRDFTTGAYQDTGQTSYFWMQPEVTAFPLRYFRIRYNSSSIDIISADSTANTYGFFIRLVRDA